MSKFRRGATIGCLNTIAGVSSWSTIIGERELHSAIYVEYGIAEEVIALLEFKDGSFEVGIGECLRPYNKLYSGKDREKASRIFLEAVKENTWS